MKITNFQLINILETWYFMAYFDLVIIF